MFFYKSVSDTWTSDDMFGARVRRRKQAAKKERYLSHLSGIGVIIHYEYQSSCSNEFYYGAFACSLTCLTAGF